MKNQITGFNGSDIKGVVPSGETNILYYTDILFDLLFSYDETNSINPFQAAREFVSWVETITNGPVKKRVFFYLLEHKVTCSTILRNELNLKRPTIHRILKDLTEAGFIEQIVKARYVKKVGQTPALYGLKNRWNAEDVSKIIEEYRIQSKPTYLLVKNITQTILEVYLPNNKKDKITYGEVVAICKGNCRGFYTPDISSQVARQLQINHEIEVWR